MCRIQSTHFGLFGFTIFWNNLRSCFQLYSTWSPVSAYTTWVPLLFFASVTAFVALIDDCRRMFGDRKLNNRKITRIDVSNEKGKEIRTSAKNIRVGDLVKVHAGEEIPADLVIIYSSGKDGAAFITTANLDGEVDLKTRPVPKKVFEYIEKLNDETYDPDDDDDDDDDEEEDIFASETDDDNEEEDNDEKTSSDDNEEEEESEKEISGEEEEEEEGGEDLKDESTEHELDTEGTEEEEGEGEGEQTTDKEIDDLYENDEEEEEEDTESSPLRVVGIDDTDDEDDEKAKLWGFFRRGGGGDGKKRKLQSWPFVKHFEATITCPQPNPEIYEFNSSLSIHQSKKKKKKKNKNKKKKPFKVSLSADHLLFQSCMLKNTEWAIGVVVFTGNETKCGMNKRSVPSKRAKSDYFMDKIALAVFCFQMFTSVIVFGSTGIAYSLLDRREKIVDNTRVKTVWYLALPSEVYPGLPGNAGLMDLIDLILYPFVIPVSMWLLTSYMIPISLKVVMDLMKFFYSILLMKDRDMYDPYTKTTCSVRNTAIVEDLGQIEYILTDKTGTLTQNVMEFQRCSIQEETFGSQGHPAMRDERLVNLIRQNNNKNLGETDIDSLDENEDSVDITKNPYLMFFRSLALCHTVNRETLEDGTIEFQSVSPDEVALVSAADEIGVKLVETEDSFYTLRNKFCDDEEDDERWEILRILKFTSDRKRMSVVARNVRNGEIFLFSKGADDVMLKRVRGESEEERKIISSTELRLSEFSKLGLRTLVVAYKTLKEEDWEVMVKHLEDVDNVVGDERQGIVDSLYDEIEMGMKVLGSTAIEDKLQEEVERTIWMMREAGIAVWMLTGDKLETAMQIGISCNLISVGQRRHVIREDENTTISESIDTATKVEEGKKMNRRRSSDLKKKGGKVDGGDDDDDDGPYSLIIEGRTLKLAFEHHRKKFRRLCLGAETVVCARVTPGQKAEIVKLVKKEGKMTLSIGDGGNDVPMIQEAHVGVGIIGKEGLQASRAADFSFGQFRFLIPLIFVHGHYSLIRSGLVIQYSFYKNITLAFCQIMFNILTRVSGQRPYNDQSLTLFNTWFTLFVPILVFDRTINKNFLKTRPKLYSMSKGRTTYNYFSAALWVLVAVLHGLLCLFVVSISYSDNVVPSKSFSPSKQYFGIVLYSAILCTVNGTFILFSSSYNGCNCCVLGFILLSYFFLLFLYNILFFITSLPVLDTLAGLLGLNDDIEIFWVMMQQYTDPTAYFSVLFTVVVATLPLLVFKYIKFELAPNIVERFHKVEKRFSSHRKLRRNRSNMEEMTIRESELLNIGGGYVVEDEKKNEDVKV